MKYTLAAVVLGAVALYAAQAYAGNCTTTCTRTFNGGSVCNTWCY